MVYLTRHEHFNAAHRLFNPAWDNDRNNEIFGKCNNPNFHGHNYELVVGVTGEVDPETGFVIDIKDLAAIIYEEIETAFDHKNLNLDVPEFKNLNPTAENIAIVIWNKLRARIGDTLALEVTLFETPRNFVRYKGN